MFTRVAVVARASSDGMAHGSIRHTLTTFVVVVFGDAGIVRLFFLLLLLLALFLLVSLDLLHERERLGSKLAALADGRAVLVEEKGERQAHEGEERGDGRGPVDAEAVVHVGREERERGAEERSKDRVGGEDRGGKDGVRIDEVVHDAQEHQDHAEPKGTPARMLTIQWMDS